MDLTDKNVVYVGGFGGIGLSTCKIMMLRNISSLAILDIVEKPNLLTELKELNPSVDVFALKLDVCDKQNIEDCFKNIIERTQIIDVLINGCGVALEQDVEQTVTTNLIGLINCTLLAIPLMDKALNGRGGVIVNISSLLGLEPAPPSAVYSATKHGVIGFTRSLAYEYYYNRTGIAMITFCPGLTITPFINDFDKNGLTFPYSADVANTIMETKSQTADECGLNLVKVIEMAKNDSLWLADGGDLEEVKMFTYWQRHT